jgi:Domain of unknown function (DUF4136)
MRPLVGLLFLAANVFAQKVQIESDQTVNFEQFRTFAIREARLTSKNPSLNNELVKKQLDSDIERYASAKGLSPMPSGRPDLNLRYTLGSARGVETEAYPAGWRGWGTRVVRVPFAEGTLVIDLRNPQTHSLVWRAIVRTDQSDPNKIASKLNDMVKKAFSKYPPQAK